MPSLPSTLTLLLALSALTACQAPPPQPFVAPPLHLSTRSYAGSVISGAEPAPVSDDFVTPDAARVRCTWTYVERLPDDDLPLLTGRTRLLLATLGGLPIQVANELLERSRVVRAEDAERVAAIDAAGGFGRTADVNEWNEVLPRGVTTTFRAEYPGEALSADDFPLRANVCVSLPAAPDAPPTLSLVIEQPGSDPAESRVDVIVLVDAPEIGGEGVGILFPSPFPGADGAGILARVEVRPAPDATASAEEIAEHEAALDRCRERLHAAAAEATARGGRLHPGEASRQGLARALGGLNQPRVQRTVLVFIAGETGASLTQDIALGADDASLGGLIQDLTAAGVTDAAKTTTAGSEAARLGFKVESVSYRWLARLTSEGKLGPDLEGILLRHAGAAGRFPGTIVDLVASSSDLEDLSRRIDAENLSFLEDSDPGARVRAFDWLTPRHLVPDGYSPLAPVAERRAALKRAADVRSAAESAAMQKNGAP